MWGRIIRVEVSGPDGLILDTKDLRVDIDYLHRWGINDLCTVSIFNLSRETFKSLAVNGKLTIKLSVGHRDFEGDLPVLLEGHINNMWGQKQVPNHITYLYCVPNALYRAAANVPVPSAKKGDTFEDHLINVAAAMEIKEKITWVGKASESKDLPIDGRNVDKTLYKELISLGEMFHSHIRIHKFQMSVFPDPRIKGALQTAAKDRQANILKLNTTLYFYVVLLS